MLPCILGLSGPVLTPDERAFFGEAEPGGFILFGRNCVEPAQLRALTDELRGLTGRADVPILIDQEGGRCTRLGPPHWPDFPAQWRFAELYAKAPISALEAARVNAAAIGLTLAGMGINVACLPVLDLRHPGAHVVIGERALGSDPVQVAALGRMVLEGLAAGGVAGVIKHMPGHGRARADSHEQLPLIDAGEDALADDLAPFRKLAGRARIGMTAHIVYAAWDRERPATLSPPVISDIVRGSIGFEGLLLSDDLEMAALSGSLSERARGALAAGCDLILYCSGVLAESREIAAALPSISPEAAARMEAALPGPPQKLDLPELLAKRDALLRVAGKVTDTESERAPTALSCPP